MESPLISAKTRDAGLKPGVYIGSAASKGA